MNVFRPILFIDDDCPLCLQFAQILQKLDFSGNIKVRALTEVSKEGHRHLKALADSKTTMIFAEPRMRKVSSTMEFCYSQKGRATLRVLGYMPVPLSFFARLRRNPRNPQDSRSLLYHFCPTQNV